VGAVDFIIPSEATLALTASGKVKWRAESIHLFLLRIHGHERFLPLDLPGPIRMTVPSSKPRHWLASNPFGSNLSTGCYSRI